MAKKVKKKTSVKKPVKTRKFLVKKKITGKSLENTGF